jgi:FAD/FMN-containing dehydrogenase
MADTDTAPVALPDSVIEQVAAIVGDRLRTPADEPFAEHPSFYGGDDRIATLTIRPQDTAEVALILPILAEARVPVVVRGGGHSMAHRSRTTGVIIDLALLDTVDIDAEGKVGTAGGGVIAGRYTEEAAKHGLATGFGDSYGIGVAGIL